MDRLNFSPFRWLNFSRYSFYSEHYLHRRSKRDHKDMSIARFLKKHTPDLPLMRGVWYLGRNPEAPTSTGNGILGLEGVEVGE